MSKLMHAFAVTAGLLVCGSANAAFVNSASPGAFDAGSSLGVLALDFDVANFKAMSASVTAQATSERFNSVLQDVGVSSFGNWRGFVLRLDGAAFDTSIAGSLTENAGAGNALLRVFAANQLRVQFSLPNPLLAEVGDPLLLGGSDFAILADPGATYSISMQALPEPAPVELLGLGLLALGAIRLRRSFA